MKKKRIIILVTVVVVMVTCIVGINNYAGVNARHYDKIEIKAETKVVDEIEVTVIDMRSLRKYGKVIDSFYTRKACYLVYKKRRVLIQVKVPRTVYEHYHKYGHEGMRL